MDLRALSELNCGLYLAALETFRRHHERCVDDGEASVDTSLVVMTGLRPHQRAQHLVCNRLFCLAGTRRIFRKEARVVAEFAKAIVLAHFPIAEHQGRDHGRVDPLHDQVGRQGSVLAIGFLSSQKVLFKLFVEEVVASSFLLRLEHELVWIGESSFDDGIDLGPLLAQILQAPDALEQCLQSLSGLLRSGDLPQKTLV